MRDLWRALYQSITACVHLNMSDGLLRFTGNLICCRSRIMRCWPEIKSLLVKTAQEGNRILSRHCRNCHCVSFKQLSYLYSNLSTFYTFIGSVDKRIKGSRRSPVRVVVQYKQCPESDFYYSTTYYKFSQKKLSENKTLCFMENK